jgi:hypothetical protein
LKVRIAAEWVKIRKEVDILEMGKIAVKLDKVDRILTQLQKSGEQAKSWAAIGQQSGV